MSRPNIVFAFADDWGRYAGAYAKYEGERCINELIYTPNFDRVAREGALFLNAHVPAPSCTPCRSSILSGQYFWRTGLGAILQGALWDETIPTYPLMIEEDGYYIGYTYKVWSPGKAVNAPYGAERTRYESAGNEYRRFSHYVTERAPVVGIEAAKQELLEETRRNFQGFLDKRPFGRPFCYWWGPTNTHRTWERGSGKDLWGLDPNGLKGRLPEFLPDVHAVREDVCDYLGECLAVDAGLGVLLDVLDEADEIDNTLLVVSGDHGIPGFPRGKCNLYDLGNEVALAVRWPGHVRPHRVINDFVNLMDLCPTFLEAAGVPINAEMNGKSLVRLLESEGSGNIEPDRTWVVTGRERHVAAAREGNLPYPQRAIRNKDFLYIRNFAPERWPMGDPAGLDDFSATPLSNEELCNNTYAAFADMDASPTKAWMIRHRAEENISRLFSIGFGKRPAEEFYDLRIDPDHMSNLADSSEYESVKSELSAKLMQILAESFDPRVVDTECRYESSPYSDPWIPD